MNKALQKEIQAKRDQMFWRVHYSNPMDELVDCILIWLNIAYLKTKAEIEAISVEVKIPQYQAKSFGLPVKEGAICYVNLYLNKYTALLYCIIHFTDTVKTTEFKFDISNL
jgi:hypothetical protein